MQQLLLHSSTSKQHHLLNAGSLRKVPANVIGPGNGDMDQIKSNYRAAKLAPLIERRNSAASARIWFAACVSF